VRVATNDAASLAAIDDDTRLVELLRARDEETFVELIDRYHSVMLRLANVYVRDRAVAQEMPNASGQTISIWRWTVLGDLCSRLGRWGSTPRVGWL